MTAASPRRSEEQVTSLHVEDVGPRRDAIPPPEEATPEGAPRPVQGAWSVLRRGLRESPELRAGLGFTVALALANAVGRLILPILIGFTLDRGILGPEGFRPGPVVAACAAATLIVVAVYLGAGPRTSAWSARARPPFGTCASAPSRTSTNCRSPSRRSRSAGSSWPG